LTQSHDSHSLERQVVAGLDAITLRSPGELAATFVPAAGMVCSSLRHRGEELLGQRGGVERYVASGSTMGIPLLYPWANRISQRQFVVGGEEVNLDRASNLVRTDPNGLPIHGLLAGHSGWRIERRHTDRGQANFRAGFDFDRDPELIGAFPFPHRLEVAVSLKSTTLEIATTLRPTGATAVPISFGYHPYFVLPAVPRRDWQVELPVARHLVVDERKIPTGTVEKAEGVETGPLGERTFDDGYVGIEAGACFVLAGGGQRIEVRFLEGYPVAVLYAPAGEQVICFEPMTAPTNALVSGDGLRWAQPDEEFTARFSVTLSDERPAAKA